MNKLRNLFLIVTLATFLRFVALDKTADLSNNIYVMFFGDYLFIVGDVSLNRKISDFGQMYLFDIAFLFMGLFATVRKFNWRWGIVLLWLILAPINSALTFVPPDSLRSALMIVPLIIISSFGAITLFGLIHKYTDGLIRYSSIFTILFLMIWDISHFLYQWL